MAGAGEGLHQDLAQGPAAPVLVPRGDHGDSGEIMLEQEEESGLPAATPLTPVHSSHGEIMLDREDDAGRASAAPSTSGHGSAGEILSEQEDDSGRAPAAPSTAGVHSDESHHTDVETGGGMSRSARANNWGRSLCVSAHPNCTKWVYAALFLGGILLAMSSRDTELSRFSKRINDYEGYNDSRYRLGAENALRVSLGFVGFFTVVFVTTVCTKKVHECRNFWNSNLCWALLLKIVLMTVCLFGVQFIPSPSIQIYGSVARFGAWLFLAIQLISFTRLIMSWNEWQQLNPEKWRWLMKAISIILNFGSFGFIFWLLHEHRSNIVDFTIVIVTLVLIVLMILTYSKSEVTAGWLAHGVMIAYVVFMCWTVIRSEPQREFTTNAKHRKGADWLTITSFVCVVIVTGYSAFSTGEDHDWLQFNEEVPSDDDIPYGFGYFHLVFALGSMYFGMLCVGWNAYQTMERWTTDFGWWSAVVRAVNGLLAAVLYIWMLRTPFIWNKRKLVLSCSGASWVPHVTFQ